MWDTRSIIVRFRRQRGNACLPGEPKPNVKKVKEESSNAAQVKKEQSANHVELKPNVKKLKDEGNNANQMKKDDKINHADKSSTNQDANNVEARLQDNSNKAQNKPTLQVQEQNTNSHSSVLPTFITSAKTAQEQQQQPWVIDMKSNNKIDIKSMLLNCVIYIVLYILQLNQFVYYFFIKNDLIMFPLYRRRNLFRYLQHLKLHHQAVQPRQMLSKKR